MGEEPANPEESGSGSAKKWATIAGLCASAGTLAMIVGMLVSAAREPEPQPADETDKPPAATEALPPMKPAALLAAARQYLEAGNVGEAYRYFQKFTAMNTAAPPDEKLRFQLGVCAEGVGDNIAANQIYESLSRSAATSEMRAAATLGIARLRFRDGQFAAVDHVLSQGLLTGTFAGNNYVKGEAEYIRAVALSRLGGGLRSASLLSDTGLVPGRLGWSLPQVMATLGTQEPVADTGMPIEVSGIGIDASLSVVLERQSLKAAVEQLATACELTTRWSTRANDNVENRSTTLNLQLRTTASVLDQLFHQLGLTWRLKDTTIEIVSTQELPKKTQEEWLTSIARRSLWTAVTAFPDSRRAPLALLSLGNLDADNDPDEARARYDELLRQYSASPLRTAALFNRAKVELASGDMNAAENSFQESAEFGTGSLNDAIALLFAGRLRLEAGSPNAANPLLLAIGHLNMQQSDSSEPLEPTLRDDALAAAVQTLAIAHLESDNPLSANNALVRNKQLLQYDPYRDGTAFLTALATYKLAATPARKLKEGETLIAALIQVQPEMLFPRNATVLIGEAWNELGVTAQMAAVYSSHLKHVRSDWIRKRMLVALVDYHKLVGDTARVRQYVTLLGQTADGKLASQIAQAEFALRIGKVDQSLTMCRRLLDEPEIDQSKILKIMGRAFQRVGNFADAALCFGGMLPQPGGTQ
ncbi:MAG: tol-pal system YbgF family protein [Planctomycetaceae bacterium]